MSQAPCILYNAEKGTDFYDIKNQGFHISVDVTECEQLMDTIWGEQNLKSDLSILFQKFSHTFHRE